MSSTWFAVTAFLAAGIGAGLSCVLVVQRWASVPYRRIAGFLSIIAAVNLANAIGLCGDSNYLFWRQVAFAAELFQPALLILAGTAFVTPMDGRRRPFSAGLGWGFAAIGVVLGAMAVGGQVFQWKTSDSGETAIVLGAWGRLPYAFVVIAMTMAIAQLEVVLRSSREPLRHQLKFMIIGMGGLAGYQIYQASQLLLYPVWKSEQVMASGIVTIIALGLVGFGLGRSRLRDLFVNTYVSHQALIGSVSFIAIGGYLLAVGVLGTWLREKNQPLEYGLSIVMVFSALVVLMVALFSKTARAEMRRVLTRNLYRSKYDYRAQWLHVTEAFHVAADREAILDALLDLLIKTFPTQTMSIWTFREADRRFVQSRALGEDVSVTPIELSHPVMVQLTGADDAVLLDQDQMMEPTERDRQDDPLRSSGIVLCFPIHIHRRLVAFIALGEQLHGDPYGIDECDLLRVLAHQVGMLLSHATLAEERRVSVELDAVHRFSIFCLHDLKNLAARLSLVAQNAERHGEDPVFQASAMRTVRDTAAKITALMSKLSLKSAKLVMAGTPEPIDLSALIEDIVVPLKGDNVRWHIDYGGVQSIIAVREEVHQVILNVVLNAKQAINDQGDIWITLSESQEAVAITVRDTGCGISEGSLESLFQPARSSRPGGLGIGLYQCKQIVEAHQGTIQIRSEAGQGTHVQIRFPLSQRTSGRPQGVLEHSVLPA
jgi:putative PEP-CTERM system histidine kinase